MKRTTISLSDQTYKDLSELADALGCSRSALTEVILARGLLRRLKARLDFLHMESGTSGPVKRYRGHSIREIEEQISELETNYQGELWDAVDDH